jgi:hypothetical protein
MSTLFPETISYNQVTGSYVEGVWTPGSAGSTFEGSVQPLNGKDLQSLNIGREDRGLVKVYSGSRLNVSLEGSNKSGDEVIWKGQIWEIVRELQYQNDLIPHYKYFAEYRREAA